MTRRRGDSDPGGRTDEASKGFFLVLLVANIVMFVCIGVLELRAFKIAELSQHKSALKITIDPPSAEDDLQHHRAALIVARNMYADGRAAFRKCALCHEVNLDQDRPDGGKLNYGPELTCVTERGLAETDNLNQSYRYSPALVEKSLDIKSWSLAALIAFIENPKAFVPPTKKNPKGTRMPFPGLASDGAEEHAEANRKQLRDIIQFLYWTCTSAPYFEELSVVRVTGDETCEPSGLRAATSPFAQDPDPDAIFRRFEADTDLYLLPKAPDGC